MRAQLRVAVLVALFSVRIAAAAPAPSGSAAPAGARPAASAGGAVVPSGAPVAQASSAPVSSALAQATPSPVASASSAPSGGAPGSEVAPTAADEGARALQRGEGIDLGRQITTTIVWLVLMCVAIWLILRVMYGRLGVGAMGRGSIQVVDRQMLGPQKALLTVRVPGKVLLLGMTDHAITTLAELAPDALDGQRTVAASSASTLSPPASAGLGSQGASDRLTDLAALFGRRTAQPTKGEESE